MAWLACPFPVGRAANSAPACACGRGSSAAVQPQASQKHLPPCPVCRRPRSFSIDDDIVESSWKVMYLDTILGSDVVNPNGCRVPVTWCEAWDSAAACRSTHPCIQPQNSACSVCLLVTKPLIRTSGQVHCSACAQQGDRQLHCGAARVQQGPRAGGAHIHAPQKVSRAASS